MKIGVIMVIFGNWLFKFRFLKELSDNADGNVVKMCELVILKPPPYFTPPKR